MGLKLQRLGSQACLFDPESFDAFACPSGYFRLESNDLTVYLQSKNSLKTTQV